MLHAKKILTLVAASVALAGIASTSMAETQWQKNHPRRTEVNARLANQNRRITQERKAGEITRGQAHALRAQDHAIRKEERAMASTNGGHITKSEKRALNQQEKQVSREIGK